MIYRCPECRTRRKDYSLFLQHLATSGHKLCDCGGYAWKHRAFSTYCRQNPQADVFHASREGVDGAELEDILLETVFVNKGRPMKVWPERGERS